MRLGLQTRDRAVKIKRTTAFLANKKNAPEIQKIIARLNPQTSLLAIKSKLKYQVAPLFTAGSLRSFGQSSHDGPNVTEKARFPSLSCTQEKKQYAVHEENRLRVGVGRVVFFFPSRSRDPSWDQRAAVMAIETILLLASRSLFFRAIRDLIYTRRLMDLLYFLFFFSRIIGYF